MYSLLTPALVMICCTIGQTGGFQVNGPTRPRASATIDVLERSREVVVHLRNDANVVLDAWAVRITYATAKVRKTREYATDTATNETEPGERSGVGAILPGETRELHYVLDSIPDGAAVELAMLMFANGAVEGDSTWARDMLAQRVRHGRALEVWITALNSASGLPPKQARAVLQNVIALEAARMEATPGSYDGRSAYQRVQSLLTVSDDALLPLVSDAKQRLERVHEREMRHVVQK